MYHSQTHWKTALVPNRGLTVFFVQVENTSLVCLRNEVKAIRLNKDYKPKR